jgi:uncharacterized membrane protein YcaP (DUF421 family)
MRAFEWERMWRPVMSPWEVVVRATVVYAFVHILLRLLGRRELASYSTSDIVLLFLITTAIRQGIVGSDTSLTTGMVALATLVAIEALLAQIIYRSPRAARLLGGPVRTLVRDGALVEDQLRRAHISRDQLLARLRARGHESLDDVEAAYLERSGEVTFILRERPRG